MDPNSKFEAKGNEASGNARQYILSCVYHRLPTISPREWTSKKKAIWCIVLLVIIIPAVVVPVYLKVHPHHEFQSRCGTLESRSSCGLTNSPLAVSLTKLKQHQLWRQPEVKPLPQPLQRLEQVLQRLHPWRRRLRVLRHFRYLPDRLQMAFIW